MSQTNCEAEDSSATLVLGQDMPEKKGQKVLLLFDVKQIMSLIKGPGGQTLKK